MGISNAHNLLQPPAIEPRPFGLRVSLRALDPFAKSPEFKDVAPADFAKHRQDLIAERLQKMPELDEAVRKALTMRAYQVEIVAAAAAKK